jgi:hypothetical protein
MDDIDHMVEGICNQSITAPINNFDQYGFTADFAGAIEWIDDEGVLVGYVIQHGKKLNQQWDKDGVSMHQNDAELTPIVPEVTYPIFKMCRVNKEVYKFTSATYATMVLLNPNSVLDLGDELSHCNADADDLTTIEYDAERGLYHGQPCYMGMGSDILPCLILFDIKETYHKTANPLTPIPLKALKHMPFVWEQYQAFIGE